MADALEKVHYFVLGCTDLTIRIDHKFLLKTLTGGSLNDIPNPRLCGFNEKTIQFHDDTIDIHSGACNWSET